MIEKRHGGVCRDNPTLIVVIPLKAGSEEPLAGSVGLGRELAFGVLVRTLGFRPSQGVTDRTSQALDGIDWFVHRNLI